MNQPEINLATAQVEETSTRYVNGQGQTRFFTASEFAALSHNPDKAFVVNIGYYSDAGTIGIELEFDDDFDVDETTLDVPAEQYGQFENVVCNKVNAFPENDGEAVIIATEFNLKPWQYDDNLIADPQMSDEENFTLGTGWTIDEEEGEATHAGGAGDLEQEIAAELEEDKWYKVSVTVANRTAGTVTIDLGGETGDAISTDDDHVQYIQAGATDVLKFVADADFDGTISGISVQKRIAQR